MIGCSKLINKQLQIYDRAEEILYFIEAKYVSILEELMVEEAEIRAKKELTEIDRIKLIGIEAMKKYIADQLGIPYVSKEEPELIDLLNKKLEEAEIEA